LNGRQRIVTALDRGLPDRVPTFEWFIDRSVGRALTGSEDPIDVVDRLDLDAINIRPNYRHESIDADRLVDEWGIERQLTGDGLPALRASPISDIRRHLDYSFPDPDSADRWTELDRAYRRFGDERAIVLNLRDGFSDMRDLVGYEDALMALLTEPKAFSELLQRSVEYNLKLAAIAHQRFGTDIIATTDDVADAGGLLMRPATYFELIGPAFQQVIAGYRELGYRCIKHCDGNVDAVVDFWISCGIACLDPLDPSGGYTIAGMKSRFGDHVCLKGNVDCTGALCSGTIDEVESEVRTCLAAGAPGGGFILSSSNTIHRGVAPQNYAAMLSTLKSFDLGVHS